jgi:hypothetical protein
MLYAPVLGVGVSACRWASFPMFSSRTRRRSPSAGRREAISVRSACMTELGASLASCASGSAACSGLRPGSAGRCSCSVPPTGTFARRCSKGTTPVQLLHDLLRRIHRDLDSRAALPLLASGRLQDVGDGGLFSAGCHNRRYPRYTPIGRLAAGALLANRVRSGRKQP